MDPSDNSRYMGVPSAVLPGWHALLVQIAGEGVGGLARDMRAARFAQHRRESDDCEVGFLREANS